MTRFPRREDLTDEQAETLEKAAYLVLSANNEASAMLRASGVELPPDSGLFVGPCGRRLPPPPQNHFCGCPNYSGDGGLCLTRFEDHTGPDFGSGSPLVTCQHPASEHLPI
jgi:uncharacterized protein DUF6422